MGELKDKASRYTEAFGGAAPLADPDARRRKARKIRAVLGEEGMLERPLLKVLDVGCSHGHILRELTPADGLGIGVDIDARVAQGGGNVTFVKGDAEQLPLGTATVDIVICNHVYEHTDSPERMMAEIARVLRDDGACYFAGPNKYDLVEPHYGLPLLSWLPRRVADCYVRLFGKGEGYAEKPYSRAGLLRLLAGFRIEDYTARIVLDPARYEATDILPPRSAKTLLARCVLRVLPAVFPGFIFVLRKA